MLLGGCANACLSFFLGSLCLGAAASGRKMRLREFTFARCAIGRLRQRLFEFFLARCARGGCRRSEIEIREFTFQLVAVASRKGKRKGKGSARGACSTAWVLEGERAALLTHTWILTVGYLQLRTYTDASTS